MYVICAVEPPPPNARRALRHKARRRGREHAQSAVRGGGGARLQPDHVVDAEDVPEHDVGAVDAAVTLHPCLEPTAHKARCWRCGSGTAVAVAEIEGRGGCRVCAPSRETKSREQGRSRSAKAKTRGSALSRRMRFVRHTLFSVAKFAAASSFGQALCADGMCLVKHALSLAERGTLCNEQNQSTLRRFSHIARRRLNLRRMNALYRLRKVSDLRTRQAARVRAAKGMRPTDSAQRGRRKSPAFATRRIAHFNQTAVTPGSTDASKGKSQRRERRPEVEIRTETESTPSISRKCLHQ
eukprot:2524479-Pleurochrysis_carterae.AAC.1